MSSKFEFSAPTFANFVHYTFLVRSLLLHIHCCLLSSNLCTLYYCILILSIDWDCKNSYRFCNLIHWGWLNYKFWVYWWNPQALIDHEEARVAIVWVRKSQFKVRNVYCAFKIITWCSNFKILIMIDRVYAYLISIRKRTIKIVFKFKQTSITTPKR